MAYTNIHGLPEEIYNALSKNRYSGDSSESASCDYSVTRLISPIQQTILKQRYPDCGEQDIIDNLWSMFGSIAHSLLEEHGSEDSHTEKRFYQQILGKSISGGLDHLKNNQITDYKVTSVWKVMKKNYREWEEQLNCYASLCEHNGFPIKSIRIICILRDWSEAEKFKDGYPKAPIVIIDIPLWPEHKRAIFMAERVKLLIKYEKQADEALPECTNEEMWCGESKWACMKPNAKRATRVFDTEMEAYGFTLDNPECSLVERKGERRRCAKYCQVSSKCIQYQKHKKENQIEPIINGEKSIF